MPRAYEPTWKALLITKLKSLRMKLGDNPSPKYFFYEIGNQIFALKNGLGY